jgi:hypothetical protein
MHRKCSWMTGLGISVAIVVAACSPSPSAPDDGDLTSPFLVSDHFAPTGYMGDGTTIGAVDVKNDACPNRAPAPGGDCYSVVYTPTGNWAGVYWQYPANNWGAHPGRVILPGATRLTVWARGEHGGEKLELHVGGIRDDKFPYHDTIDVSSSVTLTTEWQPYTVSFGGKTYDRVIGAFGWIAHATPEQIAAGSIVFYLDGLTWEP